MEQMAPFLVTYDSSLLFYDIVLIGFCWEVLRGGLSRNGSQIVVWAGSHLRAGCSRCSRWVMNSYILFLGWGLSFSLSMWLLQVASLGDLRLARLGTW